MASVNKVILIGNLGADPELKHTATGQQVCELRLATNERWTDKQGQKQERTEWHRVIVWGKSAENCAKYLAKGRQAYVEGRLQTRTWDGKDGNKRYTTEVVAQDVRFIGGSSGDIQHSNSERPQAINARNSDHQPSFDDSDIPF